MHCRPYHTWQAGETRKSLRISAPCLAILSELDEQCSGPDRKHFRQSWLVGIIPNPCDRTCASYAFSRFFTVMIPTYSQTKRSCGNGHWQKLECRHYYRIKVLSTWSQRSFDIYPLSVQCFLYRKNRAWIHTV